METLRQRIATFYGIDEEECARLTREPSFSTIPTLSDALAAKTMKERILRALEKKEKVIVYGDYDTDGIMATSIMVYCFHKLGRNVQFYIPTRYGDGYGLSMEYATKIADAGYSLVILVDNGISAIQEVSYLLSRGVETLIIDHHSVPAALPPSVATIHPDLLRYGPVAVSAGYLSYLFSIELLEENDPYLMMLGALSTISDLMPIREYNRAIVALALRYIRKNKPREITLLAGTSYIDENVLSMGVIPAINAVGRLLSDHTINRAVHYFADADSDKEKLSSWLLEVNQARKNATSEALSQINPDANASAIVVCGRLKEGLNGLLANRILSDFGKPCAVVSPSSVDADCYVGSARVMDGQNLMDFIQENKPLFVKSGGHPHAGGFTIKKEDYASFKKAFESYVYDHPAIQTKIVPIPITCDEVNMDSYREIRGFGPFGQGYPEPVFLLRDVPYGKLTFIRDDTMARMEFPSGARFISFSYGKNALDAEKVYVPFRGKMRLREYRGKIELSFQGDKEA